MIDGLRVEGIDVFGLGKKELVRVKVVVVGDVTQEELISLRYVMENNYDVALYAA